MLEFIRDGASGGPKAIVKPANEIIVYLKLHVDRNWWSFSSVFFQHLPQVGSGPAHLSGEFKPGITLNQF